MKIISLLASTLFLSCFWLDGVLGATLSESPLTVIKSTQSADEQAFLAHRLLVGLDIKAAPHRGLILLQSAVDQKSLLAQFLLAKELFLGKHIPQDIKQAGEIMQSIQTELKQRAEAQDAFAQYCLGFMYQTGLGGKMDYTQALHWYNLAAERGDASAQNNLGMMYIRGQGTNPDFELAFKWFNQAAMQGLSLAQTNTGNCYMMGCGVDANPEKAKEWYLKAIALGDSLAEEKLAEAEIVSSRLKVTVLKQVLFDQQGFLPPGPDSSVSQSDLTQTCLAEDKNCSPLLKAGYKNPSEGPFAGHIKHTILSTRDDNGKFDHLAVYVLERGPWSIRLRNRQDIYWEQSGTGPQNLIWNGRISKEIDEEKNPGLLSKMLCILDSPRFCVNDNWYHLELISETQGSKHLWIGIDNLPPMIRNEQTVETKKDGQITTHLQFEIYDPIVYWGTDADAGIAAGLPDKLEDAALTIQNQYAQQDKPLDYALTEEVEHGHKFYRIKIKLKGTWKQNSLDVHVADAVGNEVNYILSGCNQFKDDSCGPFSGN